jgi:hypothetical protein
MLAQRQGSGYTQPSARHEPRRQRLLGKVHRNVDASGCPPVGHFAGTPVGYQVTVLQLVHRLDLGADGVYAPLVWRPEQLDGSGAQDPPVHNHVSSVDDAKRADALHGLQAVLPVYDQT